MIPKARADGIVPSCPVRDYVVTMMQMTGNHPRVEYTERAYTAADAVIQVETRLRFCIPSWRVTDVQPSTPRRPPPVR